MVKNTLEEYYDSKMEEYEKFKINLLNPFISMKSKSNGNETSHDISPTVFDLIEENINK